MRLSIAMCTYNGEKYIREQLLSFHKQTTQVDEIIVCDDCSTDNTVRIVEEISCKYNLPIKIFKNPKNLGYRKNFEQAICRCSGDLIFLSDQDDIWIPTKAETIVQYFNKHPDKNFVFTNAQLVNALGVPCYNQTLFDVLGLNDRTMKLFDRGYELEILSIFCRVTGATCAFRASLMPYCLPLSSVVAHDEAIAMASAFLNQIGYINQCLIKYRQHPQQSIGLQMAIKHSAEYWEASYNIMMWHEALVEPSDKRNLDRLRFIYRRFWIIRSPWALVKLMRMYVAGNYRQFYTNHRSVFIWDIQALFYRLLHYNAVHTFDGQKIK